MDQNPYQSPSAPVEPPPPMVEANSQFTVWERIAVGTFYVALFALLASQVVVPR